MTSQEMKLKLRGNGIPQWRLAQELGISEATLTRRFRAFTKEDAEQMTEAMHKIISAERGGNGNR